MYLPELRIEMKKLRAEADAIRCETRPRKFRTITTRRGPVTRAIPGSARCKSPLRKSYLNQRRLRDLRITARALHLAYGFLREREFSEIEPSGCFEPDWEQVFEFLEKQFDGSGVWGSLRERYYEGYVAWKAIGQRHLGRNRVIWLRKQADRAVKRSASKASASPSPVSSAPSTDEDSATRPTTTTLEA